MSKASELETLYRDIEKSALDYRHLHNIAKLFVRFRDATSTSHQKDLAQRVQWEIDFFSFLTEEGELHPLLETSDKHGKRLPYPDINRLEPEAFKYLAERLKNVSSPLLKARYAHILWCGPHKSGKHAHIAVDAYLHLARIFERRERKEPDARYGHDVLNAVVNAYRIAYQAKYRVEMVKDEIKRLARRFRRKSPDCVAVRSQLLQLMLSEKRRFKRRDLDGLTRVCMQFARDHRKNGEINRAVDMLELGYRVAMKTGLPTEKWKREIAASREILIDEYANKNNMHAALNQCAAALTIYRELRDDTRVTTLLKIYGELRSAVSFAEFRTEIDLTSYLKTCRSAAEQIARLAPSEIIEILMMDNRLLPSYDDVKQAAEELAKRFLGQSLFSQVLYDERGHVAQHFTEQDEKAYYQLLQCYRRRLEIESMPMINAIFLTTIREEKLTARHLLEYLRRKSWLGKTISKQVAKDNVLEYNWLSLLAPGFIAYFRHTLRIVLNPNEKPDLTLVMDSLSLKIEGLLRDLCEFGGGEPYYQTEDRRHRVIWREKDIHRLLHDPTLESLINTDDVLFLRYLLVEQAGYNLRHQIAHSLLASQGYTFGRLNLVLLAILRLSRYDFTDSKA